MKGQRGGGGRGRACGNEGFQVKERKKEPEESKAIKGNAAVMKVSRLCECSFGPRSLCPQFPLYRDVRAKTQRHMVIQINAESAAALTLVEECAPAPLYIQGCCHTSKSHWSLWTEQVWVKGQSLPKDNKGPRLPTRASPRGRRLVSVTCCFVSAGLFPAPLRAISLCFHILSVSVPPLFHLTPFPSSLTHWECLRLVFLPKNLFP